MPVLQPLPVDAHLDSIVEIVRRERTAVIVAPPGSGKTTRIPPALAESLGRTILLQPRRVAARALTRRIAAERGWSVGNEVGWQIRFEKRFARHTRLLVATEGVLTARLQSDPLLSDFNLVILDEFHERSIFGDVALALARQAALSRDDLALVVMSATIDSGPVARFLGTFRQNATEPPAARVIEITSSRFAVEIRHRPGISMSEAVRETMPSARGDILCFLPGKREIERTRLELTNLDALVLPLHGSLDVDKQELVLEPSARRRVILATNIAETSLTVEGVSDVIDSGLQKVLRFNPSTAIDHLDSERIALDAAEQRAGRAGRTAPGRATRLWDQREILRPHREPEVQRVDLAGTLLEIIAWGGDPQTFDWFERPPSDRIEAALQLLTRLGAIRGRHLTAEGGQLRAFPLHPRLARAIVAAHGAEEMVAVAASLEGSGTKQGISAETAGGASVNPLTRELTLTAQRLLGPAYLEHVDDATFRRALLAGYPDRVAMRREQGSPLVLLASGTGARLAREADDGNSPFVLALRVMGNVVMEAVPIERSWLTETHRETSHELTGGRVHAVERTFYDALLLREQPVPPDHVEAARLVARSIPIDPELINRARFAHLQIDWDATRELAASGRTRAEDLELSGFLPASVRRKLDQLAPRTLSLPSGRAARLDYRDDGTLIASAKLQELFGLAESPRLGPDHTAITFNLLAPNGRPVQVTQDLRSFWNGAYQQVRKELRGRYPRHPWPDDPWTAIPTHRTKRR